MPRPIGIRIRRAGAGKPTASSSVRYPSLSVSRTEHRRHRNIEATSAANPEPPSVEAGDGNVDSSNRVRGLSGASSPDCETDGNITNPPHHKPDEPLPDPNACTKTDNPRP